MPNTWLPAAASPNGRAAPLEDELLEFEEELLDDERLEDELFEDELLEDELLEAGGSGFLDSSPPDEELLAAGRASMACMAPPQPVNRLAASMAAAKRFHDNLRMLTTLCKFCELIEAECRLTK